MSWETADYHQLSRVADNLAYAGDMLWLIAQHAGQLERIADALEVIAREKTPVERQLDEGQSGNHQHEGSMTDRTDDGGIEV